MEQKIITSSSASELNRRISEMQGEGWEPIGSHQVVVVHEQRRFAGTQHRDTIYEREYSQTIRKVKDKNSLLSIVKRKENGVDCTEEESAEIKQFIKSSFSFSQHVGEGHSSDESKDLLDKVNKLFPIEFGEALEEEGL